jgi:hypothetical protein
MMNFLVRFIFSPTSYLYCIETKIASSAANAFLYYCGAAVLPCCRPAVIELLELVGFIGFLGFIGFVGSIEFVQLIGFVGSNWVRGWRSASARASVGHPPPSEVCRSVNI